MQENAEITFNDCLVIKPSYLPDGKLN